jgi:16S rRNA (uracil1498-N3)-methyltransferase
MELVVQKATELGASRIVPLATERSIVKLEEGRGRERAERWRRIAQEAARQCGRADVPQVDEPKDWAGLFGLLRAEPERRGLLLDPAAPVRLSDAARGVSRVLIAIGPEGGFSLDEREAAARAGLLPATLGKLVLRTETAGLAALAILQHLHGELG